MLSQKDFLRSTFNEPSGSDLLGNLHGMDKLVRNYESTMSPARYEAMWWQCIQACLPPASDDQNEKLLINSRLPDTMHWLLVPMKGAKKVMVKLQQKKPKAPKAQKSQKVTKKKKVGKKGNGAETVPAVVDDSHESLVVDSGPNEDVTVQQTDAELRAALYLNDVSWAIDSGCSFMIAAGKVPDEHLPTEINMVIQRSLQQLYLKHSRLTDEDDDEYTSWETLKVGIIKYLHHASKKYLETNKDAEVRVRVPVDASRANLLAFREFVVELQPTLQQAWHMKPYFKKAMAIFSQVNVDLSDPSFRTIFRAIIECTDQIIPREWVAIMTGYANRRHDLDDELATKVLMIFPSAGFEEVVCMTSLSAMLVTRLDSNKHTCKP